MQFGDYLKSCRESSDLTQEELAHSLYLYDDTAFEGLDFNTISRWERAISQPKLAKQVSILKYFQLKTGIVFPCLENYSIEEAEKMICETGMRNLLGKSKELILDYPSNIMGMDDLNVISLRNHKKIGILIEIFKDLDKGFNYRFRDIPAAQFESWALTHSNSFYVCEYKEQFFGLLFSLRLKPAAFEKIIALEIQESDLTNGDFASFSEKGSSFVLSFFAMNDKAASMLFVRYYANLIAHQKTIDCVGVAFITGDAKRLLANMKLKYHSSRKLESGAKMRSYSETLPNFLASEQVVKMILSKQSCPEG